MPDDRRKPTASEERLVALAEERAFRVSKTPAVHHIEFEHVDRGRFFSLDRRRTPAIAVCVSPESDLKGLSSVPGLTVPSMFLHGAGMTRFPGRPHTGRTPTPYAYRILCADVTAHCRLLERLAGEDRGSCDRRPGGT